MSTPSVDDPIPGLLSQVVDEYKRVTELRLEYQNITDGIRKREAQLRDHLIENVDADISAGVMGLEYQATIKRKDVYRVNPALRDEFNEWVLDNRRLDLLQKRVSTPAILELIEDGIEVPGLEHNQVKTVSITKVK